MTDRDISEIYFHERDEKGHIVFPRDTVNPFPTAGEKPDPAKQLEAVLALQSMLPGMIDPASVEAAKARLAEKMKGTS